MTVDGLLDRSKATEIAPLFSNVATHLSSVTNTTNLKVFVYVPGMSSYAFVDKELEREFDFWEAASDYDFWNFEQSLVE